MLSIRTVDSTGDMVLVVPYDLETDVSDEPSEPPDAEPFSKTDPNDDPSKPETRDILVSSKILSTASPVFQVMLDGRFREGVQLSDAKTSPDKEPFRLSLPDDDFAAMLLLCKVLHFKVSDIAARPNSDLLLALASVCDKYQCTQTLKYCGALWVRNWLLYLDLLSQPPIEDICRLLIFSYVADLPYEFCEVAWRLLLHHKGPLAGEQTQAVQLIDHPLLYQDVGSYLDRKRFRFCEAFHRAITGPWTTWKWVSLSSGCYRARDVIGRYTEALRKSGIVPYEVDLRDHRLGFLLRASSGLPYLAVKDCTNRYNCDCSGDKKESLTKNLNVLSMNIPKQKGWFGCLDCLKRGEMSSKDRECRLEHGDISSLSP
ncbi:hypothetical protein BGZ61DRAFT_355339 [Ilyonectria robusta]|uniref:uncharacterized protein n=1 Tax=Ilyonectria robusta TaxID=1079257 RepID=UPI001E8E96AF|nr:uncharacterized protein BGZ61DRAFT_355339 [Ilyonectria robusta]KAH8686212.1 hypothetical protein BGZ61DRAFT_355339 [Ilyonectria robusta]